MSFIERPGPSRISSNQESSSERIVVFDSECNLCSRAARFIESTDQLGAICLIAASSPKAMALLRDGGLEHSSSDTVVLIEDGRVYFRSEAVIRILAALRGPMRLALLGLACPRPIRDYLYALVARRRRCLLP